MKNTSLVSVIIPVYNVEDFVVKCLDSVYEQSYENIEIIVVDDGSTDKSGELVDNFAKNKSNVMVIHQENKGLSAARNLGISKAKGEWIALVDSDDYVAKDFVKKMVEATEKDNVDIVVCGFNQEKPAEEILSGDEATIKLLTKQENLDVVAWNKLYKKELFVKNNIWYPVGEKHEDSLTTYKLLSVAEKVSYIADSLYFYVERKDSIMNKAEVSDRLKMRERAAREAVEFFDKNKELQDAADISVLTAKFAFVDAGVMVKENLEWIQKHAKQYKANKFLNKKLKAYLILTKMCGGVGYRAFRKIKH